MRKILFLVGWFLLCSGVWVAAQNISPDSSQGPYSSAARGQLPGTTTNDSASQGNIGEYFVSGISARNNLGVTASVTISIAAPAVISWTANPYFTSAATNKGCASIVTFTTSGSLPTGITTGTNYYVTCDASLTANAFHISTSVDNAIAGTALTTSGTQSGTQTAKTLSSLGSGTPADFGGFSLTPGDWDLTGLGFFSLNATTSITLIAASISSGSALTGSLYASYTFRTAAEVPTSGIVQSMSTERVSVSTATTFYCGMVGTFTIDVLQAGGECRARRVR